MCEEFRTIDSKELHNMHICRATKLLEDRQKIKLQVSEILLALQPESRIL